VSLSDLAASVPEIIANNAAVSAGHKITQPMTEAFKKTRNGINQEARAAVAPARGVTND